MTRSSLTEWGRSAKKVLKGKEVYPYIFEDKRPLANKGSRDSTIISFVGQIISAVWNIPLTTPEHVFALLYEALADLGTDENTGITWLEEAWDQILRVWNEESDKQKKENEQAEGEILGIVDGFKQWKTIPSDQEPLEYITQRSIVATPGGSYYLLGPNGYYSSIPLKKDILVAAVRQYGMQAVIPLTYPKADGSGFRIAKAQELIDRHSVICRDVEGVVGLPGSILRGDTFCLNLYKRKEDLESEFSHAVDEWIQSLCNDQEEYDKLCNWIGNALAFDEGPICALSIKGHPGCGKKLIYQGLAECINTEQVATSRDFGDFASQLFKTPLLVINEGFPIVKEGMHPADAFRSLTAGDSIDAAKKFHDRITIRSPLRLLLLANNFSVIRHMAHKRDLSPEDREAIAQRIFHLNVSSRSTNYLRAKGGLSYTGASGARWIRSDDGRDSDYIVAKHFMYLYEKRHVEGNRMLVEGELSPDVLRVLSIQSGFAPEIVESIISMLEADLKEIHGIVVIDGEVYVTVNGVLQFHRKHISQKSGNRLTAQNVSSVLNGLLCSDWDPHDQRMLSYGNGKKTGRAAWWKLQTSNIYREAMDNGYRCDRLEKIIFTQERREFKESPQFANPDSSIKSYNLRSQKEGIITNFS